MKYLLLVFFLLYSNISAYEGEKLDKVSLQLHWKYQFEFAGFIAAKEKGFYKDAGLDVTLKEYNFGLDIEKEVLSGRSEYGIYNSYTLVDFLKGKPIRLVASFFKRAALVLVTRPEIKSPKDLINKKIMTGTKEDFILNFKPFFDGYGLSIDDVELVEHTYEIDDFAKGKVAAMSAFLSDQLYKLDKLGIKYNVLDPSDDNLFVLQMEMFTSQDEINQHPLRVSAFKKASIQGWQYALTHKDELVDIIYEKYSKNISKKSLRNEAKAIEKLILPYTYNVGSIDKNFLHKQIKLFRKAYGVGEDKKLNDFIFESSYVNRLNLTKEEYAYIQDADEISICLQYDQFPVDGYENEKFIGIMSDIYKNISKQTNLKFEVVKSSSLSELKSNLDYQECEIFSVIATSDTQYKTLRPTQPFSTTHFTVVSELDKSFVSTPLVLKGKILLTQFKVYKEYLNYLYPYLTIKVIEDKNKMVELLLTSDAYALITLDEEADYVIDKYGYGKLKINGFLAKEQPINASIGIQKDEPILFSIIQKALKQIPASEISDITNSWRMTRYQSVTDYSLVIKIVVVMVIFFLILLYYHRKLKNFNTELENSVNEKTRALREINEYLEDTVAQKVNELIKKDEILTVQSKQAVMGEMISMIAHQWRQPLNTITLNISNLQIQQMMGKQIDEKVLNSSLDAISETIVYLSETVDDFKTYFHPDKESAVVEIDELLNKAINFVLPRVKAAGIKLGITQASLIELRVYPNELIQVLLNILNNAIDAYENINKNDKRIDIYAKREGDSVYIYIKDEAGGIKEELLAKLFEPYFSTKGKNGTGLGLYMSQMIIEKQFGGKIDVITEDESTTFIVEIPIVVPVLHD